MTTDQLKERIKKGKLSGVYLFGGEEDYLKRHYLSELRRCIVTDEGLAPFAHFTYSGATVDFGAMTDAVMAPGMMSDQKLIEWHLPELEKMKEKELESLERLCATVSEYPGNCVVFVCTAEQFDFGTEKKPTKLAKRLSACMELLNFTYSSDSALASWIGRHFAAEGVICTRSLPNALIGRVGHNMDMLAAEIQKLCAYVKARNLPGATEKEMAHVCIRTVESDAFSFSNALLDGRTEDAFRFLGDMKQRRVEPVVVLGQVAKLYGDMLTVTQMDAEGLAAAAITERTGLHKYVVSLYMKNGKQHGVAILRRAVELCAEIDLAMKSGAASYAGLERLIACFAKQTVV